MSKVVNIRLSLEDMPCDPGVCTVCSTRGECRVDVSLTVMTLWEEGNLLDHVETARFEERKHLYPLAKRWLTVEEIDVSINAVAVDVFDNEPSEDSPLLATAERLQAMIDKTDQLMAQEQARGASFDFMSYDRLRGSKVKLVAAHTNAVHEIFRSA